MIRLIAVGASAGGVQALQDLIRDLPADLPAAVLVVLHVGDRMSSLPYLLSQAGTLPAVHAVNGQAILPGRVYVAPPDHHLLVIGNALRLSRGPKEHHTRPAIDPLFRSVALAAGPAAIGVVLTGMLDDGTAGLQLIKQRAGLAIVQMPEDALCPSMPRSALENVAVDHCVRLSDMGSLLAKLVTLESEHDVDTPSPEAAMREQDLLLGRGDPLENLNAIGRPSTFTCPDCHGSLWEIDGSKPPRFVCHTGHGYSMRSLQRTTAESADDAVWNALRVTQELGFILRARSEQARDAGDADRWRLAADALQQNAALLRSIIGTEPVRWAGDP
ncbi:MAG TPA: chemotaxis protein CheB [Burkholderiaceae bacterium]|jgi:two-component system chemotaxis response regulator CheB